MNLINHMSPFSSHISPFSFHFSFHTPSHLQVGDGTTSVTMLAAEFLKQVKPFVEDNVHPQVIVRAYRKATILALDKIKEIAVHIPKENPE